MHIIADVFETTKSTQIASRFIYCTNVMPVVP